MVMIILFYTAIMMCTRGVYNLAVTSSFVSPTMHVNHLFNRPCLKHHRVSQFLQLSSSAQNEGISNVLHEVQGITCREVRIYIENVGFCTILEATAGAQNDLVNMALATEDELDENENQLHSGDPYGAVLWPAASAVANHLLSLGENISGKKFHELTLLELGSGTGLVSIAAALGGASKIMSTDYEKIPLYLLEFAAKNLNKVADENYNLEERIETFLFDICDKSTSLPYADVIVAADIMYEPKTGIAMAHRVVEALENGSRVIVGCSPGR